MSIKWKLVLSNIAMVLIPVILSIILAIILLGKYASPECASSDKQIKERQIEAFGSYFTEAFAKYSELEYLLKNKPSGNLDNIEYLKSVDDHLTKISMRIGVIIDNKTFYISKDIAENDFNQIIKKLKKRKVGITANVKHHNSGEITIEGENDLIKSISKGKKLYKILFERTFKLNSNQTGSIYVMADTSIANSFLNIVNNYLGSLFKGIMLIIILTNGILTFFLARNIIKPIMQLKYGAEQIADGNLSFQLQTNSKDEVGKACKAFEEMRFRLKESIEKQIKVDEDRNEFLASITHDLKTPLTSIKGYVNGLKDGVANTPEKMAKYIDVIDKKVNDLNKLIDDLTYISNHSLDKIPYNFSKVDIKRFLEDFLDEYQIEFDRNNVQSALQADNIDNILVRVDIEKLKRVVTNIVSNSLKHMNKIEKSVKINIIDQNEKVLIKITDNGVGIEKKDLDRLFDKFYRVDSARNSDKGGSGLGLFISKQIIESHSGKIWVESVFGENTTICFELPKI